MSDAGETVKVEEARKGEHAGKTECKEASRLGR